MDSERGQTTYGRSTGPRGDFRSRGRGYRNRPAYEQRPYQNRDNEDYHEKPRYSNSYTKPTSDYPETETSPQYSSYTSRGRGSYRGYRGQRDSNQTEQSSYPVRSNYHQDSTQSTTENYYSASRDRYQSQPDSLDYNSTTEVGYNQRGPSGFRSRGRRTNRPYRGGYASNQAYEDTSQYTAPRNYDQDRSNYYQTRQQPIYNPDAEVSYPESTHISDNFSTDLQTGDETGYRGNRGRRSNRTSGYRGGRQNFNIVRDYEVKDLIKISALEPLASGVFLNCVALSDPKEIEDRHSRGMIMKQWSLLVGDETGCIELKVHNPGVAKMLKEGSSMSIQNGHIEMRDNRYMRLATYRGGFVSVLREDHDLKINTNLNLSSVEYIED